MTKAIDIVVNLWTKEITECYPPELDQFWDLVGILEMTKKGVTIEELRRLVDHCHERRPGAPRLVRVRSAREQHLHPSQVTHVHGDTQRLLGHRTRLAEGGSAVQR